jgi:ankyrin repeat protein/thiol-disulfide isomerase/thioredoxin
MRNRIKTHLLAAVLGLGLATPTMGLDFDQVASAVSARDMAQFKALVPTKGEATATNDNGFTLIQWLSGGAPPEYLAYLVSRGARFDEPVFADAPDEAEFTPLMIAAYSGNLDALKYYETLGADINHVTPSQQTTAMDQACRNGHLNIVRYLFPRLKNKSIGGHMPYLSWAIVHSEPEVAQFLIANGVDLRAEGEDQETVAFDLVLFPMPEVYKVLLDSTLDWDARNRGGYTPLFAAARTSVPMTRALLGKNVSVEIFNNMDFLTVLQTAIHAGNPFTVQLLLDAGADPRRINEGNGQSAIQYAQADGKAFLLPLLQGTRRISVPRWSVDDEIDTGMPFVYRQVEAATLTKVGGGTTNTSASLGKTVVLNLWGSWCPPCLREMPSLQSFYQKNRASGFEVLAVSVNESPQEAAQFAAANNLTFPLFTADAWDFNTKNPHLDVYQFPTTYILDKNGYRVNRTIGSRDWSDPKVQRFLTMVNSIPLWIQP